VTTVIVGSRVAAARDAFDPGAALAADLASFDGGGDCAWAAVAAMSKTQTQPRTSPLRRLAPGERDVRRRL
jgi:hypothetical protein